MSQICELFKMVVCTTVVKGGVMDGGGFWTLECLAGCSTLKAAGIA